MEMKPSARAVRSRPGETRRGVLVLVVMGAALACGAQRKGEPYAVVAGTVFQENGLSFPGVQVTLEAKGVARTRQTAKTSSRGEFAFRVTPEPRKYVVTVARKGFRTGTAEADVPGEGRVDVTITLQAESKEVKGK